MIESNSAPIDTPCPAEAPPSAPPAEPQASPLPAESAKPAAEVSAPPPPTVHPATGPEPDDAPIGRRKHMSARELLDELDLHAAMWAESQKQAGSPSCRRSKERRPFRTACEVWSLEKGTGLVRRQSGFTRNLSERGVGLLVKNAILKGAPVEVRIQPPGRAPVYLGGIVMWCRYASDQFHEVGVELKVRQERPIFSMDGGQAARHAPWLQDGPEPQAAPAADPTQAPPHSS